MDKSPHNFTPLKKAIHSKRKYFFAIGGILILFIILFSFILKGSKQKIINKGQAEGLPTKNVSVNCIVKSDKRTGNVTCKTSYLKRPSANLQECIDCAQNPLGCLQGTTQGFLECTANEQNNWQCSLSTSQECGGAQIENTCTGDNCDNCDCSSNAGWVTAIECQTCFSQPTNTPAVVNSPTPTPTTPQQIACYQPCTQGSLLCTGNLKCEDSNEGNGVPNYLCVNPICPGSSTCVCANPTNTPTRTPTPTVTVTLPPGATSTPTPTKTPTPTITSTPPPGSTNTPTPTRTPTPTVTSTPPPGATNTPGPTNTNTPGPTNTPVQYAKSQPTATRIPQTTEIPQAGGLFTIGKTLFVVAISILIAGIIL